MLFKTCLVLVCSVLVCSVQGATLGRIVGGSDAIEGQFPYQVSVRRLGSHTCGGSIISNNIILTAAHCVVESENIALPAFQFSIRAGSTKRRSGGIVVGAKTISIHPSYTENLDYDVAIIELKKPLTFSSNIQPIDLATEEVPLDAEVIISGWGLLSTKGKIPTDLQFNVLKKISNVKCLFDIGVYSDALLCLAHEVNNGACSGDSGGPAAYKGKLVGVAGFVTNGCGSSKPDGYAKVSSYIDWIKSFLN